MATKMTFEERQRKNLVDQIGKRIVEETWHWRGTEFFSFGRCGNSPQTQAYVRFTATFTHIKVRIDTGEEFNVPDQVCMFSGDDAMSDAVNWTADRLIELNKIITERTAPYVQGFNKYQRAIRGD